MTATTLQPALDRPLPSLRARSWRALDYVLLALVIVIAAVVRWHFVDADLSYDELWHLALSAGHGTPFGYYLKDTIYTDPVGLTSTVDAPGWWNIWMGGMDGVLHPPLYLITLRWWRDLFGDGDGVAIGYSIAWSLVAVGFTFASVRLVTDRWLAFTTALAMSVANTQAYFAQEVRGYAMLVGLSSMTLWMMTRIEVFGPSRRRAISIALMTLPLLLTHYFAFGAAIAIVVHGLMRLRGHRRAFIIALAWAAITYGVLWVPWALQQLNDIGTGDAFMKHGRDPLYELELIATAPMRLVADRLITEQPQWLAGGVLYLLPFLLLRRARWLLPWVLWLGLSVVGLVVLDEIRSTILVYLVRYLAAASPAVFFPGCRFAVGQSTGVSHTQWSL